MLLDTLDLKDKTVFHDIDPTVNYNTFSVMDYSTNKQGKSYKINNGLTTYIDFKAINDNQVLVCYTPPTIDRLICKVLTIEGTYIKIEPVFQIDEKTNTSKISIVNISPNKFVIFYNDNTNKVGKSVLIEVGKTKISILSKNIFHDGIVPEICSIKSQDNEIVLFYQNNKNGSVQLIQLFDNNTLGKVEEQIFFTGSNLWDMMIKPINDEHVLSFINSDHKLCLKILSIDKTVHFTKGMVFPQKVNGDYYQLISIDNEMVLCYFNNIIQIIDRNDGHLIHPENIK